MIKMSELLSQRQFAEKIGRSHVWVSKLVKQGKLPLVNKKIPLEEGLKAYEASQQLGYEGNREHAEKQRTASTKKTKPKPKTKEKKEEPKQEQSFDIPDDDDILPSTGTVSVDKVAQMFNRAKLAEKTFQAKLKEMDFKEKQGHLLPKEVVEADAAATAEELRGLLFSISPRIAPICEGKPAREIEVIIENAINEALQALKKSRFGNKKE
ncbi:terminase small subunit [Vibrio phage vB_VpaM_XM1]